MSSNSSAEAAATAKAKAEKAREIAAEKAREAAQKKIEEQKRAQELKVRHERMLVDSHKTPNQLNVLADSFKFAASNDPLAAWHHNSNTDVQKKPETLPQLAFTNAGGDNPTAPQKAASTKDNSGQLVNNQDVVLTAALRKATGDNSLSASAQTQTQPLSHTELVNTAHQLQDAIGNRQDAEEVTRLLNGLGQKNIQSLSEIYQKETPANTSHYSLADDIKKNFQGVDALKIQNVLTKPDNGPNLVGDVNLMLASTTQNKDSANIALVNYLSTLTHSQIDQLQSGLKKQDGGLSLQGLVKQFSDGQDSIGKDLQAIVGTDKSPGVLLGGNTGRYGSDQRTAADDFNLAYTTSKFGQGSQDGLSLLQNTIGGNSPAAAQARSEILANPTLVAQIEHQFSGEDNKTQAAAKDILNHGYVSLTTIASFDSGNGASNKASNKTDITNAIQSAISGNTNERQLFIQGQKLAAEISASPSQQPTNPNDIQALHLYQNLHQAFTKAGSKADVVQWEDKLTTGGSLVGQLAGIYSSVDAASAKGAAPGSLTGHIGAGDSLIRAVENISPQTNPQVWNQLHDPKAGPALLNQLRTSLTQYAGPEQAQQVMNLLESKAGATAVSNQGITQSFKNAMALDSSPSNILYTLQHLNPADAAAFAKGNSTQKAEPSDTQLRSDVNAYVNKLTGTEKVLADRLLSQVSATGKPPTPDAANTLLASIANAEAPSQSLQQQIATGHFEHSFQGMENLQSKQTSANDALKANKGQTLQELQTLLQNPNWRNELSGKTTSSQDQATVNALTEYAKQVYGNSQAQTLFQQGRLSLSDQWSAGADKTYIYGQLAQIAQSGPKGQSEVQGFISNLGSGDQQLAKAVMNNPAASNTTAGQPDLADRFRAFALHDTKDYQSLFAQIQAVPETQRSAYVAALQNEYSQKYGGNLANDVIGKIDPSQRQQYLDTLSLTKVNAQTDLANTLVHNANYGGQTENGSGLTGFQTMQDFVSAVAQANASGHQLSPEQLNSFNQMVSQAQSAYETARKKYESDHPGMFSQIESGALQLGIFVAAGALASTGVGALADAGLFGVLVAETASEAAAGVVAEGGVAVLAEGGSSAVIDSGASLLAESGAGTAEQTGLRTAAKAFLDSSSQANASVAEGGLSTAGRIGYQATRLGLSGVAYSGLTAASTGSFNNFGKNFLLGVGNFAGFGVAEKALGLVTSKAGSLLADKALSSVFGDAASGAIDKSGSVVLSSDRASLHDTISNVYRTAIQDGAAPSEAELHKAISEAAPGLAPEQALSLAKEVGGQLPQVIQDAANAEKSLVPAGTLKARAAGFAHGGVNMALGGAVGASFTAPINGKNVLTSFEGSLAQMVDVTNLGNLPGSLLALGGLKGHDTLAEDPHATLSDGTTPSPSALPNDGIITPTAVPTFEGAHGPTTVDTSPTNRLDDPNGTGSKQLASSTNTLAAHVVTTSDVTLPRTPVLHQPVDLASPHQSATGPVDSATHTSELKPGITTNERSIVTDASTIAADRVLSASAQAGTPQVPVPDPIPHVFEATVRNPDLAATALNSDSSTGSVTSLGAHDNPGTNLGTNDSSAIGRESTSSSTASPGTTFSLQDKGGVADVTAHGTDPSSTLTPGNSVTFRDTTGPSSLDQTVRAIDPTSALTTGTSATIRDTTNSSDLAQTARNTDPSSTLTTGTSATIRDTTGSGGLDQTVRSFDPSATLTAGTSATIRDTTGSSSLDQTVRNTDPSSTLTTGTNATFRDSTAPGSSAPITRNADSVLSLVSSSDGAATVHDTVSSAANPITLKVETAIAPDSISDPAAVSRGTTASGSSSSSSSSSGPGSGSGVGTPSITGHGDVIPVSDGSSSAGYSGAPGPTLARSLDGGNPNSSVHPYDASPPGGASAKANDGSYSPTVPSNKQPSSERQIVSGASSSPIRPALGSPQPAAPNSVTLSRQSTAASSHLRSGDSTVQETGNTHPTNIGGAKSDSTASGINSGRSGDASDNASLARDLLPLSPTQHVDAPAVVSKSPDSQAANIVRASDHANASDRTSMTPQAGNSSAAGPGATGAAIGAHSAQSTPPEPIRRSVSGGTTPTDAQKIDVAVEGTVNFGGVRNEVLNRAAQRADVAAKDSKTIESSRTTQEGTNTGQDGTQGAALRPEPAAIDSHSVSEVSRLLESRGLPSHLASRLIALRSLADLKALTSEQLHELINTIRTADKRQVESGAEKPASTSNSAPASNATLTGNTEALALARDAADLMTTPPQPIVARASSNNPELLSSGALEQFDPTREPHITPEPSSDQSGEPVIVHTSQGDITISRSSGEIADSEKTSLAQEGAKEVSFTSPSATDRSASDSVAWSTKAADGLELPVEALTPGEHVIHLTVDGVDRKVQMHVPEGYDGSEPLPVLFVLHGMNLGDAEGLMPKITGLNRHADEEGFIAVYPLAARSDRGIFGWNTTGVLRAPRAGFDDINYIQSLVDSLPDHLNVDTSKLGVIGFSEGGLFAHQIGAKVLNESGQPAFELVGSAGGSSLDNVDEQGNPIVDAAGNPTDINGIPLKDGLRPQKVFIVHNEADTLFLPDDGGPGRISKMGRRLLDNIHKSLPASQDDTYLMDGEFNDQYKSKIVLSVPGDPAFRELHIDERTGNSLFSIAVDGKHSWHGPDDPGIPGVRPNRALDVSQSLVQYWLHPAASEIGTATLEHSEPSPASSFVYDTRPTDASDQIERTPLENPSSPTIDAGGEVTVEKVKSVIEEVKASPLFKEQWRKIQDEDVFLQCGDFSEALQRALAEQGIDSRVVKADAPQPAPHMYLVIAGKTAEEDIIIDPTIGQFVDIGRKDDPIAVGTRSELRKLIEKKVKKGQFDDYYSNVALLQSPFESYWGNSSLTVDTNEPVRQGDSPIGSIRDSELIKFITDLSSEAEKPTADGLSGFIARQRETYSESSLDGLIEWAQKRGVISAEVAKEGQAAHELYKQNSTEESQHQIKAAGIRDKINLFKSSIEKLQLHDRTELESQLRDPGSAADIQTAALVSTSDKSTALDGTINDTGPKNQSEAEINFVQSLQRHFNALTTSLSGAHPSVSEMTADSTYWQRVGPDSWRSGMTNFESTREGEFLWVDRPQSAQDYWGDRSMGSGVSFRGDAPIAVNYGAFWHDNAGNIHELDPKTGLWVNRSSHEPDSPRGLLSGARSGLIDSNPGLLTPPERAALDKLDAAYEMPVSSFPKLLRTALENTDGSVEMKQKVIRDVLNELVKENHLPNFRVEFKQLDNNTGGQAGSFFVDLNQHDVETASDSHIATVVSHEFLHQIQRYLVLRHLADTAGINVSRSELEELFKGFDSAQINEFIDSHNLRDLVNRVVEKEAGPEQLGFALHSLYRRGNEPLNESQSALAAKLFSAIWKTDKPKPSDDYFKYRTQRQEIDPWTLQLLSKAAFDRGEQKISAQVYSDTWSQSRLFPGSGASLSSESTSVHSLKAPDPSTPTHPTSAPAVVKVRPKEVGGTPEVQPTANSDATSQATADNRALTDASVEQSAPTGALGAPSLADREMALEKATIAVGSDSFIHANRRLGYATFEDGSKQKVILNAPGYGEDFAGLLGLVSDEKLKNDYQRIQIGNDVRYLKDGIVFKTSETHGMKIVVQDHQYQLVQSSEVSRLQAASRTEAKTAINSDSPRSETSGNTTNTPTIQPQLRINGQLIPADTAIIVGRTAGADIKIDSDKNVGREHAVVVSDKNGVVKIADNNSKNGTYINGERIPTTNADGSQYFQELKPGDVLKFGLHGKPVPVEGIRADAGLPIIENQNASVTGVVSLRHSLHELPQNDLALLEAMGYRFKTARMLTDAAPHLKDKPVRGQPDAKWDNLEGVFIPSDKAIVVSQEYLSRGEQQVSSDRTDGVLRHEVGHAIDDALGRISRSEEFRQSYEKDLRRINKKARLQELIGLASAKRKISDLEYFMQEGETGRSEAFAELYGMLRGGGALEHRRARILAAVFHDTKKFIDNSVDRAIAEHFNSDTPPSALELPPSGHLPVDMAATLDQAAPSPHGETIVERGAGQSGGIASTADFSVAPHTEPNLTPSASSAADIQTAALAKNDELDQKFVDGIKIMGRGQEFDLGNKPQGSEFDRREIVINRKKDLVLEEQILNFLDQTTDLDPAKPTDALAIASKAYSYVREFLPHSEELIDASKAEIDRRIKEGDGPQGVLLGKLIAEGKMSCLEQTAFLKVLLDEAGIKARFVLSSLQAPEWISDAHSGKADGKTFTQDGHWDARNIHASIEATIPGTEHPLIYDTEQRIAGVSHRDLSPDLVRMSGSEIEKFLRDSAAQETRANAPTQLGTKVDPQLDTPTKSFFNKSTKEPVEVSTTSGIDMALSEIQTVLNRDYRKQTKNNPSALFGRVKATLDSNGQITGITIPPVYRERSRWEEDAYPDAPLNFAVAENTLTDRNGLRYTLRLKGDKSVAIEGIDENPHVYAISEYGKTTKNIDLLRLGRKEGGVHVFTASEIKVAYDALAKLGQTFELKRLDGEQPNERLLYTENKLPFVSMPTSIEKFALEKEGVKSEVKLPYILVKDIAGEVDVISGPALDSYVPADLKSFEKLATLKNDGEAPQYALWGGMVAKFNEGKVAELRLPPSGEKILVRDGDLVHDRVSKQLYNVMPSSDGGVSFMGRQDHNSFNSHNFTVDASGQKIFDNSEENMRNTDQLPVRESYIPAGVDAHETALIDPSVEILDGVKTISEGVVVGRNSRIASDLGSGAWIGHNVTIEKGAIIEAGAVIRDGATIKAGAVIKAGAEIGPGAVVHERAIVNENAKIENKAVVNTDARIGEGTVVESEANIGPGVVIGQHGHIGQNVSIQDSVVGDRVVLEGSHDGAEKSIEHTSVTGSVIEDNVKVRVGTRVVDSIVRADSTVLAGVHLKSTATEEGALVENQQIAAEPDLNELETYNSAAASAKARIDEGAVVDPSVRFAERGELPIITKTAKIGPHCQIGSGTIIEGILGARVSVGKDATIGEGAIIADGVEIPQGCMIMPGSHIDIHTKLAANSVFDPSEDLIPDHSQITEVTKTNRLRSRWREANPDYGKASTSSPEAAKISPKAEVHAEYIGPGVVVEDGAFVRSGVELHEGVVVKAGAWIGTGAIVKSGSVVGEDARLEPYTQVGAGTTLHKGVIIHSSADRPTIIGERVTIFSDTDYSDRTFVDYGNSIGDGASIGKGVHVGRGVEVGENVIVHEGARLGRLGNQSDPLPNTSMIKIGQGSIVGARTAVNPDVSIGPDVVIGSDCTLESACKIRHGANLGNGVNLEREVVIGRKASIGDGAKLSREVRIGRLAVVSDHATIGWRSVVGEFAYVGSHAEVGNEVQLLSHAYLKLGAEIRDRVVVEDAVVGMFAHVESQASIKNGARVADGEKVSENAIVAPKPFQASDHSIEQPQDKQNYYSVDAYLSDDPTERPANISPHAVVTRASIHSTAKVGNSRVVDSVIEEGAIVGDRVDLFNVKVHSGAIIGDGANISGVDVPEGVIIGDGAYVSEGAHLEPNALVPPGAFVDSGLIVKSQSPLAQLRRKKQEEGLKLDTTAIVHPSVLASLHPNIVIGPNVFIPKGAQIGRGAVIENTTLTSESVVRPGSRVNEGNVTRAAGDNEIKVTGKALQKIFELNDDAIRNARYRNSKSRRYSLIARKTHLQVQKENGEIELRYLMNDQGSGRGVKWLLSEPHFDEEAYIAPQSKSQQDL